MKRPLIARQPGPETHRLRLAIKAAVEPPGILDPGKLLRAAGSGRATRDEPA